MKKYTVVAIALALGSFSTASLAAGDAAAGQAKAGICAACHGATGTSPNDLWPNLAGQKAGYLVKQMKALRDGTRNDPMMTPMAKPLSDADIDNLAAFFISLILCTSDRFRSSPTRHSRAGYPQDVGYAARRLQGCRR